MMIGLPTHEMIEKAKKRTKFFDKNERIIRSKISRLGNTSKKSYPLKDVIDFKDKDFIDFVEVSSLTY